MVAVGCLTFGLILNVAIAWAAVLFSEPGYDKVVAGRAADRAWARSYLDDQRSGCFVLEGKTVGVRVQGLYECHPWRWSRRHQGRLPADGVQRAERAAFSVRKAVDEWRQQVSPTAIREVIHELLEPPNVERLAAGWPFAALECRRVRR